MLKRPLVTGIILMMLLTLLTYSNHFYNAFHFDDFHTIVNNANIRSLNNIQRFFTDGSSSSVLPQNQAYRPVTVTSLAVDYWLAGDYFPAYFQSSTFILFLLQGLLMVFLFKKIFEQSLSNIRCVYIALIAVAWYLLHPANAETVNYIIARTDVQSTFFVLLGFVLYVFSPFCRKTFIYLIAIGIGALCKPTTVMFAPLLFFYILFFEANIALTGVFKKTYSKQLLVVFLKTLPAFMFCAFMYVLTYKMTPETWQPGGTQPLQYLITQPFVILHYFGEFFLPVSLSADTDWQLLPTVWDIRFVAGCVFILLMLAAAVYTSKKKTMRPIAFGILWFFIALVPTSSIIPLGEVLNDHRMYFPFVGLTLSVAWALGLLALRYQMLIKRELSIAVVLLLLSAYAYGAYKRNQVWHTEESLWRDVIIKSPGNGRGLMNYGLALFGKGDYDEAEKYFKKAEEILPGYAFIYTNLGLVNEKKGDLGTAENYYKAGVKLGSQYPDPYCFYSTFLIKQWRYGEAGPLLLQAINLSPLYVVPRIQLMNIYSMTGNWDKLKLLAQQTLHIAPKNSDALNYLAAANKKENELDIEEENIKEAPDAEKYTNLSLLNYQAGRYGQCIATAQEAIKLDPHFAGAYNNIGAACIKLQQYDKAIDALKQALLISPGFVLAKNNLLFAQQESKNKGEKTSGLTADGYINLSLYYFNKGRYMDCIAACGSAIALQPNFDLAYNNICAAYNKLGKYDKAVAAAKKGLRYNPNSQVLKNNLAEAVKGLKGK